MRKDIFAEKSTHEIKLKQCTRKTNAVNSELNVPSTGTKLLKPTVKGAGICCVARKQLPENEIGAYCDSRACVLAWRCKTPNGGHPRMCCNGDNSGTKRTGPYSDPCSTTCRGWWRSLSPEVPLYRLTNPSSGSEEKRRRRES